MQKFDYTTIEQTESSDAHINPLSQEKMISDIVIDKNFEYEVTGVLHKTLAILFRFFVSYIALPIMLFFKHNLIIKGRRNLRGLKTGAVSISNHVCVLDSGMVAQALYPRKVMFHAQEDTFRMPVVRHIVKYLGGIPIPNSLTARSGYINATNEHLKRGNIVQIFPEASMWPYYDKIRPFKTGAFHFAVKNNVPIIPICINFRKPTMLEKLLPSRNTLATVHIGKPIYPNTELGFKDAVNDLTERSHKTITKMNYYFKLLDNHVNKQRENENNDLV